MIKLIRLLNLVFASLVVVTFSYLDFQRDRQYPKVTTLELVPVSISKLEVVPAISTNVETETQSTTTTKLEVENQPVTPTKVEVESESTTKVEVETPPTPATKVELETPPTPATKVEVETPPSTKVTTATVERTLTELKAEKTKQGIRINLPEKILFDFDKYNVRAQAKPTLTKINQLLNYYGKAQIFINGHTDSKGDDTYNQNLSQKRAAAVKYYFINVFQVPATRLQTKGFGKTQPIAPNNNPDGSDNPESRQKNRRVEVIIKT